MLTKNAQCSEHQTLSMSWVNSIPDAYSTISCLWLTGGLISLARNWILEYLMLDPKSRHHLCHQSQAPSSSLSFLSSWQCWRCQRLDSATLPTKSWRPSFSLDFIRCVFTVLGSALEDAQFMWTEPCFKRILYAIRKDRRFQKIW